MKKLIFRNDLDLGISENEDYNYVGFNQGEFSENIDDSLNRVGVGKRLIASLRQIGTNDPIQRDIENTASINITWTRVFNGTYNGYLENGFISGEYVLRNLKPYSSGGKTEIINDDSFLFFESYPVYIAELSVLDDSNIRLLVKYAPTNRTQPSVQDGRLDSTFDWQFYYYKK